MNYIAKQCVFRDTRYWMHSIEWQKRGLPHAQILIWLAKNILPDQVNDIICADIPDPETDSELHDIVIMNMIRGLCAPSTINHRAWSTVSVPNVIHEN